MKPNARCENVPHRRLIMMASRRVRNSKLTPMQCNICSMPITSRHLDLFWDPIQKDVNITGPTSGSDSGILYLSQLASLAFSKDLTAQNRAHTTAWRCQRQAVVFP